VIAEIIQFTVSGIATGAISGMVALGFVIIYSVTRVVNFAQGVFVMLGGLITVSMVALHVPVVIGVAVAAIVVGLIGALYCLIIVLPFNEDSIAPFIAALGVASATEGIVMLIWGFDPLAYEPFSGSRALNFAGASIYPQALWVIGSGLFLLLVTYLFLQHTYLGKSVRACAMDRKAARLMGIDVGLMSTIAFAFSASICAVLGAIATPLTTMSFTSHIDFTVNGFAAAVFGGLERPIAAFFGAIVLGIVGAFAQAYVGNGYDIAAALILMLLVLVLRPEGVFSPVRA
jgi:branched-chain amino acid transport system permease protein